MKKFQSWRTAHSIEMAYNTKTCSIRCRRNDPFTDVTKSVQNYELNFDREKEHVWGPHISDTIFFLYIIKKNCTYVKTIYFLLHCWSNIVAANTAITKQKLIVYQMSGGCHTNIRTRLHHTETVGGKSRFLFTYKYHQTR